MNESTEVSPVLEKLPEASEGEASQAETPKQETDAEHPSAA